MIIIKNLTFSYNPREDRLIFTINHNNLSDRLDFFVTRKKIIEFLHGFDLILINNCDNGKLFKELYKTQQPLPKEETKQESRKENNAEWERSIDSGELAFTQIKAPLLLDAISYTNNQNIFIFQFISNGTSYAQSTMDCILFQKTLSSLMRIVPFVAWGISPHILD